MNPYFSCCICDKSIESTDINPCIINIMTNWDKSPKAQHNQNFWCHLECFRSILHNDIQQHLVIHLLGDKE